jgi:arylsulfatase A
MSTSRAPADRPNIILINCDDLGYGDLECYGSRVNQTPHLSRVANEGLRLTDFYMASPVCSPSRGAMLTGCYPRRIGFGTFEGASVLFPGHAVGLNPSEITLAQILKNRGYATQIVGKWHCGDQPEFLPTRHGFDHYFGLPYSNDMGRLPNGTRPPLPLLRDEEVIQAQPDQAGLTERYVDESLQFIRAKQDQPFFLYFAHMHVHIPLYAPWRFLKSSRNGPYGAAVECIDWSVGMLLHEIQRLGLDQNTLLIFTTDNGARGDRGGSNAPLSGRKATTGEGGQRVPCLLRWPGMIPAGQVSSELATSMDFLPTLALLSGAEPPADRPIDGRDLRQVFLAQPGAKSPHEFFAYYMMDNLEAIRSGPWKYRFWKDGRAVQELYHLGEDIGESRNRVKDEPGVVRQLENYAQQIRDDIGDALTNSPGRNCRPCGRVTNPRPLTEYQADYPYLMAEYDLPDVG